MPGDPDAFPMERLKKRYVSYICVGGATTPDWVSLGTPTMALFGFPAGMKVIANYDAHGMGNIAHPYLNDQMVEDMHEIGSRTALA